MWGRPSTVKIEVNPTEFMSQKWSQVKEFNEHRDVSLSDIIFFNYNDHSTRPGILLQPLAKVIFFLFILNNCLSVIDFSFCDMVINAKYHILVGHGNYFKKSLEKIIFTFDVWYYFCYEKFKMAKTTQRKKSKTSIHL